MLDISRADLASSAGIAERTLVDFERGARQPHQNNLAAIRRALEGMGAVFIEEGPGDDEGAGVRAPKSTKIIMPDPFAGTGSFLMGDPPYHRPKK